MKKAYSRYGVRVLPNTLQIIAACKERGEYIQGPQTEEFEQALAERLGGGTAVTASFGRMAFYYILRALDFPAGSEIVFPALTFWVMPEMARVAGLKPVFADIDPHTFNLDPAALERAITPRTRAVVPTHLYGLPCDMESILETAARHNIKVVEDCAHALGALWKGRPVGTMGDAAIFSFQTLKPLNTYGGGAAFTRSPELGARIASLAQSEPWPSPERVDRRMLIGRIQRIFTRPDVFTWTAFPILWASSFFRARPDIYLWEAIRPLYPLPEGYAERFPNVQAALGLAGLRMLDGWTETTRAHAQVMDAALQDLPGVRIPEAPRDRTHVYYQYCAYVPDRDWLVKNGLHRGVDVETLHVDVCSSLELFGDARRSCPFAEQASLAVQLPVYATLSEGDAREVADRVRDLLSSSPVGKPLCEVSS